MANYPKKLVDPTEAALSAIQEALNVRDDEEQPANRPDGMSDLFEGPAIPGETGAEPASPPSPGEFFDQDAVGTRDVSALAGRAANDDQQSIGQVLQALQRRPARTSYVVAAAFSGAWVLGCIALSWAYLSQLHAAAGSDHSSASLMIGFGAAALLPVIFFFGVAHMAWRAQELR